MTPHPVPALFPPGDGAHHTWPAPNYVDPETRDWGAPAGIIAMCVVTCVVVGARLWARFHLKRTGGVDDWLIIAAMVCCVVVRYHCWCLVIDRFCTDDMC
jgi:hypothetical protein